MPICKFVKRKRERVKNINLIREKKKKNVLRPHKSEKEKRDRAHEFTHDSDDMSTRSRWNPAENSRHDTLCRGGRGCFGIHRGGGGGGGGLWGIKVLSGWRESMRDTKSAEKHIIDNIEENASMSRGLILASIV